MKYPIGQANHHTPSFLHRCSVMLSMNFHLKIDTGPLIHKLLRDAIYGREGRGNPTIAPPKNHVELR